MVAVVYKHSVPPALSPTNFSLSLAHSVPDRSLNQERNGAPLVGLSSVVDPVATARGSDTSSFPQTKANQRTLRFTCTPPRGDAIGTPASSKHRVPAAAPRTPRVPVSFVVRDA